MVVEAILSRYIPLAKVPEAIEAVLPTKLLVIITFPETSVSFIVYASFTGNEIVMDEFWFAGFGNMFIFSTVPVSFKIREI